MNQDFENESEQIAMIAESKASSRARELERIKTVESAVKAAFQSSRASIVHALVRKLGELAVGSGREQVAVTEEGSWIEIESMSRLRSVVGGRFQNLKDRWTQAGFPLREHRGDKEKGFKLDERGWLELASWISKQGYEVRLRPDKPECLFEIRQKR